MITTIFTIIFIGFIGFYAFMITPFGVMWTMKNMDDGKPCYGMIIMFISVVPVTIIGLCLGFIK